MGRISGQTGILNSNVLGQQPTWAWHLSTISKSMAMAPIPSGTGDTLLSQGNSSTNSDSNSKQKDPKIHGLWELRTM